MTAKDVLEREQQVMAFWEAKNHAAKIGLPIVAVTPHTAVCVLHRIEELEEELSAYEHTVKQRDAHIKTWMDKVAFLDYELTSQQSKVSELNIIADGLLEKIGDLENEIGEE